MASRILLCLAHMSGNEQKYIQEAFDDNWVVPLGPNVNAFEKDLEAFVKSQPSPAAGDHPAVPESQPCTANPEDTPSKTSAETEGGYKSLEPLRVVALASGTSAVHLSLVALGVGPGDEVICQSFTFCASCNPIVYQGATPVFVDSEPDTWNMDPELLDEAIRDRLAKTGRLPKAIVVVYLYGMPARIDEILAVADRYGIPVVEDAAEGLGSRFDGRVCGTFGRYGVLSFNGNKMITTSGGGALICPDEKAWNEVMFYATQAREAYPYYQHEHIGYNYRMSNICAGIGRGQMTVLADHIAHHRRLAAVYREEFRDAEGLTFHDNPSERYDSNFWLNTVTVDPEVRVQGEERAYSRGVSGAVGGAAGVTHAAGSLHTAVEPNRNVEALRLLLDEQGVESRPLWKPMHLQPVFAQAPCYTRGVSESLFGRGLCLPSGPWVSEDQARRIAALVRGACR